MESLVPKLGKNQINKYGLKLVWAWFRHLSGFSKLGFFFNLFDIATDIIFVDSLRAMHKTLAYASMIVCVFSTFSFCTLTFLDITSFANNPEDKEMRRILRIRYDMSSFYNECFS